MKTNIIMKNRGLLFSAGGQRRGERREKAAAVEDLRGGPAAGATALFFSCGCGRLCGDPPWGWGGRLAEGAREVREDKPGDKRDQRLLHMQGLTAAGVTTFLLSRCWPSSSSSLFISVVVLPGRQWSGAWGDEENKSPDICRNEKRREEGEG